MKNYDMKIGDSFQASCQVNGIYFPSTRETGLDDKCM